MRFGTYIDGLGNPEELAAQVACRRAMPRRSASMRRLMAPRWSAPRVRRDYAGGMSCGGRRSAQSNPISHDGNRAAKGWNTGSVTCA